MGESRRGVAASKKPAGTASDAVARRGRRGVVDHHDLNLMELLSIDGRASTKHLAEHVGLTDATVAARIKQLTDSDVMRVRAVVDWNRVGYRCPMFFLLRVTGRPASDVATELAQDERVLSVASVLGSVDLIARVLLIDPADALDFTVDVLGPLDGVAVVTSLLDVDSVKHMNAGHTGQPAAATVPAFPSAPVLLDDLDRELIAILAQDARQSLRQVGRSLDVSEHTVRVRLRRLEEAGMVKVCAQVNPLASGAATEFAYVGIKLAAVGRARDLVDALARRRQFETISRTVGEHDIVALVSIADRADLVALADELRATDGVGRVEVWSATALTASTFPWGRFADA